MGYDVTFEVWLLKDAPDTLLPMRSALIAGWPVLAGSSRAPPTPSVSPVFGEVEQLFEARRVAIATRDLAGYERTYDPSHATFATCMREDFTLGYAEPASPTKVEPFGTYHRVVVSTPRGHFRYFVRRDAGGRLRLTEPQPNEVGEARSRMDGPIRVDYWAVDEDVSEGIGTAAHHAYDVAAAEALGTPKAIFSVQLYPVRSFLSGAPCWLAGSVGGGDITPVINLPVYMLSFDRAFRTPTVPTYDVVVHEALHWIQGQNAYGANVGAPWWLREGWPDRVARIDRSGVVRTLCTTSFPTRDQLSRHGLALLDDTTTLDAGRQYAAANVMVEYLFAAYGPERYWDLYGGVARSVDLDVLFRGVLGVDQAAFYAGWLMWVKTKYC
jgi:hypothetical protein